MENETKNEPKNEPKLTLEDIGFGKYKGKTLSELIRDRKYCIWLLKQDWFQVQYPYLYDRLKEYSPFNSFLGSRTEPSPTDDPVDSFFSRYPYFSLLPISELKIVLSDTEKLCYGFYLSTIETLKQKIRSNKILGKNPFDIKAPSAWLKDFEQKTGLNREVFKEFLASKELQNITTIMEDIKQAGGLEYKGGKSFLIAKKNSLEQEAFWEKILKLRYGRDISVQYKHDNRFYDFVNIRMNTLYECKLGLKDYNPEQFEKYKKATGFQFIYLIGTDCVVDMNRKKVYSTAPEKYSSKTLLEKGSKKKLNFLEETVASFSVVPVVKIEDAFGENLVGNLEKTEKYSEDLLVDSGTSEVPPSEARSSVPSTKTDSVDRLLGLMKKIL